ncbi:MAG: hypothetical protein ACOC91_00585 [bacterium]
MPDFDFQELTDRLDETGDKLAAVMVLFNVKMMELGPREIRGAQHILHECIAELDRLGGLTLQSEAVRQQTKGKEST